MENETKTMEVIMLPTRQGILSYDSVDGDMVLGNRKDDECYIPQHLYIVSDAEIKEGDWYIYTNKALKADENAIKFGFTKASKKIEASTDGELRKDYPFINIVPKVKFIPQSFIEQFVKSNGTIEVDVEMSRSELDFQESWDIAVEKDGTIIIK